MEDGWSISINNHSGGDTMMTSMILFGIIFLIVLFFTVVILVLNKEQRPLGKIPSYNTRFSIGIWDADQIDKAIQVIIEEWCVIYPNTNKKTKKLIDKLNIYWEHHRWTKNKQSIVGEFISPTSIRLWRGPGKSQGSDIILRINYTALTQGILQYLHEGIFKEPLTIDQVYDKYGKLIAKIHSKTENVNVKL